MALAALLEHAGFNQIDPLDSQWNGVASYLEYECNIPIKGRTPEDIAKDYQKFVFITYEHELAEPTTLSPATLRTARAMLHFINHETST